MSTLQKSIDESVTFFKRHILWICLIILPIAVPLEIFSVVMENYFDDDNTFAANDWLPLLFEGLLYPISQGAIIFYMVSALTNEYLPLKQYYLLAIKFWFPLFFLYLITSGAVVIGSILFIVPGIIIMSRVAFSEFYCLLHEQTALESFSSSWNETKEQQWFLLKGILVIYAAIYVPKIGIAYFIYFLEIWNPILVVIIGSLFTVLSTLLTIFTFRVYTSNPERLDKASNPPP
jgi:hypothetical protein